MLFWLTLAAATAFLLWYMVAVPGTSHTGALKPLTDDERERVASLREHVRVIASHERNVFKHPMLEQAAQYIENGFDMAGYHPVRAQRFVAGPVEVRNIEVELKGGSRASEIVIVGAHYDSVAGSPGANDNGSGVAAMLELARLMFHERPARTVRFVAFVSNLGSRPLLHEAVAAFRRHAAFLSEAVAAPAFLPGVDWSDHWSFWREGWPALMVTDTAFYRYPHYHTPQDTLDRLDYERLARVVTGLHGMLRELAGGRP